MNRDFLDKDFFYKVKIKEHEFIKEWFLDDYQDYLDKIDKSGTIKTDFHLTKEKDPPYSLEWLSTISPYIKSFAKNFGVTDQYSYNFWVSQYEKDDTHQWHMHGFTHFACVYYLELPFNENSTEFWKKDFSAKEGEMVFFPGWWIHRSGPQMFKSRKTVIAGNLNFINHSFLPE
jgi:hypothetical protein